MRERDIALCRKNIVVIGGGTGNFSVFHDEKIENMTGDFNKAVEVAEEVLKVRGKVLPVIARSTKFCVIPSRPRQARARPGFAAIIYK